MNPLLFLRVYKDQELITVKQFPDGQISIGQSADSNLQLAHSEVAQVHAMIESRNGQYYLCDLGSERGTKLNGQPILDHAIVSGDEIHIGPYRIEFHIGLPKPKNAPPGLPPKPPEGSKTVPAPPKLEFKKEPPGIPSVPKQSTTPLSASGLNTFEEIKKPIQRANYGTYAPPSSHKDVYDLVKPSKGNLLEVMVVWGERIIETKQFEKAGVINVGSHPKNSIVMPVFGSPQITHPLIRLDALATIFLTDAMTIEISKEKESRRWTQNDLTRENRLIPVGMGHSLLLQQGEMAKISFGSGLSVVVRYTSTGVRPMAAPFLDFTSGELVGLVTIMAISAILGLYLLIYTPPVPEEEEVKEPERKAVFLSPKRTRVDLSDSELKQGLKSPTTEKKTTPQRAAEGAASEAAPNKSQSNVVKPTTPNPGKDQGIKKGSLAKPTQKPPAKEAAGSVGPKAKDVTKTGLLSVFGKAGTQQQLRSAEQGAGVVGGLGQSAKGEGADVARGSGTVEGFGSKDLGKGGAGESTVGISGVKTKGRGGGVSGYGTGNLGDKGRAAVTVGGEGESFTGTIDKEGIRRVVRQNQRQIQACYEKALNQDPGLTGKVVLEWEIGERGRVGSVRVLNSSLGSRLVERCMMTALKQWTFPEPPPDQIAVVAFPFVFMSQQ